VSFKLLRFFLGHLVLLDIVDKPKLSGDNQMRRGSAETASFGSERRLPRTPRTPVRLPARIDRNSKDLTRSYGQSTCGNSSKIRDVERPVGSKRHAGRYNKTRNNGFYFSGPLHPDHLFQTWSWKSGPIGKLEYIKQTIRSETNRDGRGGLHPQAARTFAITSGRRPAAAAIAFSLIWRKTFAASAMPSRRLLRLGSIPRECLFDQYRLFPSRSPDR
jgi:hypothetical protein